MAVEGIAVDGDLGVEGDDLAALGDDQRVDLDQRRVLRLRGLGELRQRLGGSIERVIGEAGSLDDRPRLDRGEGSSRIDVLLDQRLRILRGDRLDVHAALGGDHRQKLLLAAVEDDRGVVLGRDRRAALDPDLLDPERPLAVGTDDVHAEDRPGVLLGLGPVGGDLDPAGLATAADQHLGLDRTGVADPLSGGDGVLDRGGDLAARHGDTVRGEELLALILEKVHQMTDFMAACAWGRAWRGARCSICKKRESAAPCASSRCAWSWRRGGGQPIRCRAPCLFPP